VEAAVAVAAAKTAVDSPKSQFRHHEVFDLQPHEVSL